MSHIVVVSRIRKTVSWLMFIKIENHLLRYCPVLTDVLTLHSVHSDHPSTYNQQEGIIISHSLRIVGDLKSTLSKLPPQSVKIIFIVRKSERNGIVKRKVEVFFVRPGSAILSKGFA